MGIQEDNILNIHMKQCVTTKKKTCKFLKNTRINYQCFQSVR